MKRERQAILSLVAMGRITPAEAERLLAAWNAGREEFWMIAVAAAACFGQYLPTLQRMAHTWLPGGISALHHTVTAIMLGMGGMS